MQSQFTDKATTALQLAATEAKAQKQHYIGTEHILIGLLEEGTGVAASVLTRAGVTVEALREMIRELLVPEGSVALAERRTYSPRAEYILNDSHEVAARFQAEKTGTEHILYAIINDRENVAGRLLAAMKVQLPRLMEALLFAMGLDPAKVSEEMRKEKNAGKRKEAPSTLAQYSRDLTALAREGKLDPVIGRDDEIRRVIQILSRRTKNNPCLMGEPGVGKTAVVEGLASRIVAGNVPFSVQNKRLLTLDLSGMVAGSKYRGEFEERIKRVVKEVIEDGNVILFLDELHTIIGAGGAEGAIDASNILKPSLARGEIQLIGATTISEYRKYIEKDAALERRFQPVTVEEPTVEEAKAILKGIAHKYEEHHRVHITDAALEAAVTLSARYINDRNLPDKAIDLIDEASSAAKLDAVVRPAKVDEMDAEIEKLDLQIERSIKMEAFSQAGELRQKQKQLVKKRENAMQRFSRKEAESACVVDEEQIAKVVSTWTKIPLEKLNEKESDKLLKLESILHKRVIGQEEAVTAVAKAIRRGRVGLQDPNRPIGSFLFLGPTGVGKTELTKALAEAMFGSENALIRVDMSEYMEGHSVSKMIGSPPGYVGFDEGGQLSEKVRRNPYSVVLFDEIEKAHPDVFNILLQVLDDGHITDSKGRKVSFKNTILIMTSNIGASYLLDGIDSNGHIGEEAEKLVMNDLRAHFRPEFLNRLDETILFKPLTKDNITGIIKLIIDDLNRRLSDRELTVKLTPEAEAFIVENAYDPVYGARPLKRYIQKYVETLSAKLILADQVDQGDTILISVENEALTAGALKQA